jgi:hypothetical protein
MPVFVVEEPILKYLSVYCARVVIRSPLQFPAPRPKICSQHYRDHKQSGPELTAYISRPSVIFRERLKELLHEGVVTGVQDNAGPQAS